MGLPTLDGPHDAEEMRRLLETARKATDFLKALAHEGRLMILCHLAHGERSVTELETLLSQRQAAVSQQLARLRLEGLVETRREGKVIYYRLADGRARKMIEMVYELFCGELLAADGGSEGTGADGAVGGPTGAEASAGGSGAAGMPQG